MVVPSSTHAPETAPPRTHAGRSMWRDYRPALLAALPSGAIGGALTAVGFQLDGLGEGAGTASLLATAALLALVGVLFAAVAAIGSIVAVLLMHRRLQAQRKVGYGVIALGAGIAVGGATLLAGTASEGGDQGWAPIAMVAALAAAVIGGVVAAVVTALALRWRRLLP